MTNYHIFNTEQNPIYMQQSNVFASPGINGAPELDAAKNGVLYILNSGSVSVGSGSSLLLQAANPVGSGKRLFVSRVAGGTTAAAALTIASGGTIAGGTTPAPFNALFGNSAASAATTRQNTGTLGGAPTTVMTMQVTSGMFAIDFSGSLVVQAGQTISLTLGAGALTGSLNLTWWEA
ncbi:hypothetical protein I8J29_32035 [Paenibacillus sp. MWE-103]|uniref:BclA C-terminal domain-containing protein n=1 Tax=Paenibacillus artemisiicola TaxID=1172618 RepID=A0ABS3WL54_9BACL|nr:hypothetical protein [Paenibacillus artemisiicola]MBO7748811.1 hypothetical protein [Paenibacillus artemisiicola]